MKANAHSADLKKKALISFVESVDKVMAEARNSYLPPSLVITNNSGEVEHRMGSSCQTVANLRLSSGAV